MTLDLVTVLFAAGAVVLLASVPVVRAAPRWPGLFWTLVPLGFFLIGGATFLLVTGAGGGR